MGKLCPVTEDTEGLRSATQGVPPSKHHDKTFKTNGQVVNYCGLGARAVAISNRTENHVEIDAGFGESKSQIEKRFTSVHAHVQLHVRTTRLCYVVSVHPAHACIRRGIEKKETTDTHTEHSPQTGELILSHINSRSQCSKNEVLNNSVSYIISNRELKIES